MGSSLVRWGVELEGFGLTWEQVCDIVMDSTPDAAWVMDRRQGNPLNWTVCHDGTIDGEGPFELRSPAFTEEEPGFSRLRAVCPALRKAGARVDKSCGLHVHHEASYALKALGGDINRLALAGTVVYAAMEKVLDSVMPPSRRRGNNMIITMVNDYTKAILTQEDRKLPDPRDIDMGYVLHSGGNDGHHGKISTLDALNRHSTIEFRQHSGTLQASKIIPWVRLTGLIMERMTTVALGEDMPQIFRNLRALLEWLNAEPPLVEYWLGRQEHFGKRKKGEDGMEPASLEDDDAEDMPDREYKGEGEPAYWNKAQSRERPRYTNHSGHRQQNRRRRDEMPSPPRPAFTNSFQARAWTDGSATVAVPERDFILDSQRAVGTFLPALRSYGDLVFASSQETAGVVTSHPVSSILTADDRLASMSAASARIVLGHRLAYSGRLNTPEPRTAFHADTWRLLFALLAQGNLRIEVFFTTEELRNIARNFETFIDDLPETVAKFEALRRLTSYLRDMDLMSRERTTQVHATTWHWYMPPVTGDSNPGVGSALTGRMRNVAITSAVAERPRALLDLVIRDGGPASRPTYDTRLVLQALLQLHERIMVTSDVWERRVLTSTLRRLQLWYIAGTPNSREIARVFSPAEREYINTHRNTIMAIAASESPYVVNAVRHIAGMTDVAPSRMNTVTATIQFDEPASGGSAVVLDSLAATVGEDWVEASDNTDEQEDDN